MREYFRQPDIFPTITALITAPDTVAGQTWRCVLPLLGLTFDQRTSQDALISAVITAAFGGAVVPDGVTCRLLADANKADYTSGFDARQTPLGSICFELQFDADFAGMTDIPIVFTVAGLATDAPADDDITLPTITPNTTAITLKDFQGGTLPGGFYSEVAEGGGAPSVTTITGTFSVTDLSQNEQVEILVDHHVAAVFSFCEYPVITDAPAGVIISVLARGVDNDSTNGTQFVLLVQNGGDGSVSYDYDGNFTVNWSRKGYI